MRKNYEKNDFPQNVIDVECIEPAPVAPLRERFITIYVTPGELFSKLIVSGENKVDGLFFAREEYRPSARFYKSLARVFKMSFASFSLFTPFEIFERLAKTHQDDALSVTLDAEEKEVLGIVPRHNAFPLANQIRGILESDARSESVTYASGVLSTRLHVDTTWEIPGDSPYRGVVVCDVPVDGIERPTMTLGYNRLICANGATAFTSLYRTQLEVKDSTGGHFSRLIASFDNPEGFSTLNKEVIRANKTCASVRELLLVEDLISRHVYRAENRVLLTDRLQDVAGNPCVAYGVTSLSNIGTKRRPLLPVKCTVGELMHVCTELGTHHSDLLNGSGKRSLEKLEGDFLSGGHDMDGLYTVEKSNARFFLDDIKWINDR